METLQQTAEREINKILKIPEVIFLKEKLKFKINNCYCKGSIEKTYMKLFNLLDSNIRKIDFPDYLGDPIDLSIYFCDKNNNFYFLNVLQFSKAGINNLNNYINVNVLFQNYINGNNIIKDLLLLDMMKKANINKNKKWVNKSLNIGNLSASKLKLYGTRYTPDNTSFIIETSTSIFVSNVSIYSSFSYPTTNADTSTTAITLPSGYNAITISMCGGGGSGASYEGVGDITFAGGGSGGYIQVTIFPAFPYESTIYNLTGFVITSSNLTLYYTGNSITTSITFTAGDGSDARGSTAGTGGIPSIPETLTNGISRGYFFYSNSLIQLSGGNGGDYTNLNSQNAASSSSGPQYTASGAGCYQGLTEQGYITDTIGTTSSEIGLTITGGNQINSQGGHFNGAPEGYGAGGGGGQNYNASTGLKGTGGFFQMIIVNTNEQD